MRPSAILPLLLTALPTILAYEGEMTYYTPGMGSCGISSSDAEDVVALSIPMMQNGANPNANPRCGSMIGIWNPNTKQLNHAKVVDTCQVSYLQSYFSLGGQCDLWSCQTKDKRCEMILAILVGGLGTCC